MAVKRKRRRDEQRKTVGKAKDKATEERRAEAVQYAMQGYSYEAIGQTLGVSKTRAWQLVDEALKAAAEERKKNADALLQLELERLDAMTLPVARRAMGGETGEVFDPLAIDKMLAISERRARLLGLNAPTRSETAIHGKEGAPPVMTQQGFDDATRSVIAKLDKALAAWEAEDADRADEDAGAGRTGGAPL